MIYMVFMTIAVFDVYNKTSYSITYHEDYMVFCHNKHYYSFTTMKEFEKYFMNIGIAIMILVNVILK